MYRNAILVFFNLMEDLLILELSCNYSQITFHIVKIRLITIYIVKIRLIYYLYEYGLNVKMVVMDMNRNGFLKGINNTLQRLLKEMLFDLESMSTLKQRFY